MAAHTHIHMLKILKQHTHTEYMLSVAVETIIIQVKHEHIIIVQHV